MSARRPSPEEIRRILVVKLSSLGDLFHPLPAVRALKAASGATVDWLVHPAYVPLVDGFEDVNRVLSFPRHRFLSHLSPFLAELRRERYDLVVDFQGLLKSAIPAALARRSPGALRIGPSFCREGSRLLYSAAAGPCNKQRHAVDECLDVVRWLGWPELPPEFRVRLPAVDPPGPEPRIALIPASRWATKNWPPEYFAEVATKLLGRGATIVLLGGRDERPVCDAVEQRTGPGPGVINLAGRTSLVQLGGVLQTCRLAITVDSGPMHMAAALGIPVLALFGPTDPARTGPFGRRARVLWVDGLPCRPCFSDRCARHDLACQRQLYPSRVAEEALKFLAETGSPIGEARVASPEDRR